MITSAETRVQDRKTGIKGALLNDESRPIAIVQWDNAPHPTWADWSDLA
ncbi:hypothetical protein [Mycobacterium sp. 852013-50091_SCH5140682]|nr:hypothetical protein [Mycobacterium sp. 852013-50091_SCH5140682]